MLDVVTRKIVGWSVGLAENTVVVAEALRRACESHGIPAIFYSDRGPGYRNRQIDHATLGLCARLGITTTHSLPPQCTGARPDRAGQRHGLEPAGERPAHLYGRRHGPRGAAAGRQEGRQGDPAIRRIADAARPLRPSAMRRKPRLLPITTGSTATCGCSTRSPDVTGRATPNEVWADFGKHGFEPGAIGSARGR